MLMRPLGVGVVSPVQQKAPFSGGRGHATSATTPGGAGSHRDHVPMRGIGLLHRQGRTWAEIGRLVGQRKLSITGMTHVGFARCYFALPLSHASISSASIRPSFGAKRLRVTSRHVRPSGVSSASPILSIVARSSGSAASHRTLWSLVNSAVSGGAAAGCTASECTSYEGRLQRLCGLELLVIVAVSGRPHPRGGHIWTGDAEAALAAIPDLTATDEKGRSSRGALRISADCR